MDKIPFALPRAQASDKLPPTFGRADQMASLDASRAMRTIAQLTTRGGQHTIMSGANAAPRALVKTAAELEDKLMSVGLGRERHDYSVSGVYTLPINWTSSGDAYAQIVI